MAVNVHSSVRNRSGFTLLEVMAAVALASIIAAALYRTFFSALKARDQVTSSVDRAVEASRFLDVLSMEVHSAFYNPKNPFTFFYGENSARDGVRSGYLSFTSASYQYGQGDGAGDLVSVKYTVGKIEDGSYAVFKETGIPYTREAGTFKLEAISGVEGFEVDFLNGGQWAKAWDSRLENAPPVAVRARVFLKGGGGGARELSMTAGIMAR